MIVPKAYCSVKKIRPDINLLMVIAILGAIGIQEWFEAASVAFLFSLALCLEMWSVGRARRAISSLLDLAPPRAHVMNPFNGQVEEKQVDEIEIGTRLLIKPGEKVPLDGVVASGISSINQSPITGESIPCPKEEGDEVFAGTLNEEGALEITVTKRFNNTTLARIIRLVEEAKEKRSKNEQWVERFAKVYTPLMLFFSILVMIIPPLLLGFPWFDWIYQGLVLLVIACPCALVISTPVSIVSALTSAARTGVLIKGGIYLETIGKIKVLALDKTGTLTYGHPEVQTIVPLNQHTELELLVRAAALEQNSDHPLAKAIMKMAHAKNIEIPSMKNFTIIKGKGAEATLFGKQYWMGSHRLMHEEGQETEEVHAKAVALEDAGHSMIAIGTDDHVCGLISVADEPRREIAKTILALKELGIEKIVMLTGDNVQTAKAIAEHAGIEEYMANLLPEDKVNAVENLKQEVGAVAMIGDGVNDAPALACATLGIAMGGMGADVAMEAADIALMSDDLSRVPWLIKHSRWTLRVIKQNIGFSLFVKGIFFVLALLELATLWMAIAADTGATLIVIANALRLLKRKNTGQTP
ncbi:MAG: cadmium-translocating P-type ATPase [Chlamydiia bacterium]|nr:cadmium-translocating P-type ATPase [Chlamydiia bacterium]